MNAWQELVKMALLGTEKMPLQTAVLPQNIQNILEKADKTDKEAYFLKAAALTLTYWKAGRLPDKTPLPDMVAAPDETRNAGLVELPDSFRPISPPGPPNSACSWNASSTNRDLRL